MITTQTIPEQLTEIYLTQEKWHAFKMPYEEALKYHKRQLENGFISVYESENGEVLGYYERHFVYNVCFLDNAWIKEGYRRGEVFKELYRRFFATLPDNINRIMGEKQKLGGKLHKVFINKGRKDGNYKS